MAARAHFLAEKGEETMLSLVANSLTSGRSFCKPATARALDNELIRAEIALAVAPHALRGLGQVNRDFYRTLHAPKLWSRQYAPATIDWSSQAINTELQPGRPKIWQRNLDKSIPSRALGTFAAKQWSLNFMEPNRAIRVQAVCHLLDAVTKIGISRNYAPAPGQTRQQAFQALVAENRPRARAFLRYRFYRMEHGLSVAIYTEAAKNLIATIMKCSLALIGFYVCLHLAGNVESDAAVMFCGLGAGFCLMGVLTFSSLIIETPEFDVELRNLIAGPADHVRLNLWARHLSRLEDR